MPETAETTAPEPAALPVPVLPLARYELAFRTAEPVALPALAGPVWRGVLGRALKRMADGLDPAPRGIDAATAATLYCDLFETPPPPDAAKMRRYTSVPHAYVIFAGAGDAPLHLAPGDATLIGLTLVGRANAALAAILAGFRRAGEAGLGRSRGRLLLDRVDAVWRPDPAERIPVQAGDGAVTLPPVMTPAPPPLPRFVEVRIVSPLRLLRDGRLVGPAEFQPWDMLGYLVRRVAMLSAFHTDHPHETDFRRLKEIGATARIVERTLAWRDQSRWSAGRAEEIAMGGIVGWFVLDMAGLEPLWPYLWLGPWLHAGKSATMGLGAIALHPA